MDTTELFGTEKISRILFRLAPPVMLAQLIQALYNIIDSLFVGRYSGSGLTALSIIYPIQLLMIALAVGTGVGINTAIAARLGLHWFWLTFPVTEVLTNCVGFLFFHLLFRNKRQQDTVRQ